MFRVRQKSVATPWLVENAIDWWVRIKTAIYSDVRASARARRVEPLVCPQRPAHPRAELALNDPQIPAD